MPCINRDLSSPSAFSWMTFLRLGSLVLKRLHQTRLAPVCHTKREAWHSIDKDELGQNRKQIQRCKRKSRAGEFPRAEVSVDLGLIHVTVCMPSPPEASQSMITLKWSGSWLLKRTKIQGRVKTVVRRCSKGLF